MADPSSGDTFHENLRIFACDIIRNAGMQLKLHQVAISTAQMLLQRVYHTKGFSFECYFLDITAMAALFLAAKIEECPRKASSVIDAFVKVVGIKFKRSIYLIPDNKAKIRDELIKGERKLLRNLGFNLLSSYPHKILTSYYQAIVAALDPEGNYYSQSRSKELIQLAWNYCNDSLRIDIFTRYSQETVACACIQMACERVGMLFPKSTDGHEWYELFVDDPKEVEGATAKLEGLYQRKPPDLRRMEPLVRLTKFYGR